MIMEDVVQVLNDVNSYITDIFLNADPAKIAEADLIED